MIKINIIKGDIKYANTEAVVFDINETLASYDLDDTRVVSCPEFIETFKKLDNCEIGGAIINEYSNKGAKYLIKANSPKYQEHKYDFFSSLTKTYTNALKLADEYNLKSISFPCMSAGMYGYLGRDIGYRLWTYEMVIDEILKYSEENPSSKIEECNIYAFDDFSFNALKNYQIYLTIKPILKPYEIDEYYYKLCSEKLFFESNLKYKIETKPFAILGYDESEEKYFVAAKIDQLDNVISFIQSHTFPRNMDKKDNKKIIDDLLEEINLFSKRFKIKNKRTHNFEISLEILNTFDFFFEIGIDLKYFRKSVGDVLYSHMWNGYNPWTAIVPIVIDRLEDIPSIKSIEYKYK